MDVVDARNAGTCVDQSAQRELRLQSTIEQIQAGVRRIFFTDTTQAGMSMKCLTITGRDADAHEMFADTTLVLGVYGSPNRRFQVRGAA